MCFFFLLGGGVDRETEMVVCLASILPSRVNCIHMVQCLIKKDRDDQSSAMMDAFYEKLVTAYRDPALAPIQTPGNSDGRNSPLLQATEV